MNDMIKLAIPMYSTPQTYIHFAVCFHAPCTRQAALVLLFVLAWRKNDEDLEAPWGYPA